MLQYKETMAEIQRLSNERQRLWWRASQLSDSERARIRQITDKLGPLWDQYRREYAAYRDTNQSGYKRAA